MRIVVTGYMISYPVAGYIWQNLQYLLGFKRLGHDVYYLEDSWDFLLPYHPLRRCYEIDSSYGRLMVGQLLKQFDLEDRWMYYNQFEDCFYGKSRTDVAALCATADLFLNVSGLTPMRELYASARTKAIIDIDPVYTQLAILLGKDRKRELYAAHDRCFTFGCNIGTPGCSVPTGPFQWKPTRQPIVLDLWSPSSRHHHCWTTIANWDSADRNLVFEGRRLSWSKSEQFFHYLDIPGRTGEAFELALAGIGLAPRHLLASRGWRVIDAGEVSQDLWRYRAYIGQSKGEFSVAKEMNTVYQSGWFSDRSLSYLAMARPVVVQNTGFGTYLPSGEGVFAFQTEEDVLAAFEAINRDYTRHSRAARDVVAAYFEAAKVLRALLDAL